MFVEAAACGVPQVAGDSGGAAEAVEHDVTGLVIDDPDDVDAAVDGLPARCSTTPTGGRRWRTASRRRAESVFAYDVLAAASATCWA